MKRFLLLILAAPLFVLGQGGQDFSNFDLLDNTYGDGQITENGITYIYDHVRSEGDFPIDGKGMMLRRAPDSQLSWTVTNGIGNLKLDYRKAFEGGAPRQIELVVNGESAYVSPEFGEGTGDQTDVYLLDQDINLEGEVTIAIRVFSELTGNKQMVIDNVVWTAFEDDNGNGNEDDVCDMPEDIIVDDVDATTAFVLWEPSAEDQEFIVSYGEKGFNPEEGTMIEVAIPMVDLEDLTPETVYEVYVKSVCSDDTESDWSEAVEFETLEDESSSISENKVLEFTFYPNPVQTELNINGNAVINKLEVYNVVGELVVSLLPNTKSTSVNMASLPKGVYLVKLELEGENKTLRVIKK